MWEFEFMKNAYLSGTIIALICGCISTLVILRRNAFAAHALAHTSLTGAAGAVLIGLSAMAGQLIVNLFAATLMGLLGDKVKKADWAVGMVLALFLGLGSYFLFLYQNNYAGGIMWILFGNILAVSMAQIKWLLILGGCILITLAWCMRPLVFSSMDPVIAASKNVPQKMLNIIFFLMLAVAVSMGCQIVGVILVFVLLIAPGAIASQWCQSYLSLVVTSSCVAIASIWLALPIAYHYNLPPSFCITMILCLTFFISILKSFCRSTL